MNVGDLAPTSVSHAIRFHNELNPVIWDGNRMKPEVRQRLLVIAKDFKKFLEVDYLDVEDITISGSNAAYTYTPHSDIDLHLLIDVPNLDFSTVFRQLFDAKKFQYNETRKIKIKGYDVELYVQNPKDDHKSAGIFSVLNGKWINVPKQEQPEIDDLSVKCKVENFMKRIDAEVEHESLEAARAIWEDIKEMRKAGLFKEGEFSAENLAFKVLRNNGYSNKILSHIAHIRDKDLSLEQKV